MLDQVGLFNLLSWQHNNQNISITSFYIVCSFACGSVGDAASMEKAVKDRALFLIYIGFWDNDIIHLQSAISVFLYGGLSGA